VFKKVKHHKIKKYNPLT